MFSAQVNDEISRQIFDDLDKQLDAQMMAELEKCQEEQSRLMDEELDRQVTTGTSHGKSSFVCYSAPSFTGVYRLFSADSV